MTAVTLAGVPVDPDLAKRLERAAKNQARWRAERDDLICEAAAAGGGAREIARLVGLTHPAILKIVGKASTEGVQSTPTDPSREAPLSSSSARNSDTTTGRPNSPGGTER